MAPVPDRRVLWYGLRLHLPIFALALLLMSPPPLAGQGGGAQRIGPMPLPAPQPPQQSHLRESAVALGANALVGGLTAGVLQELRDGSFWDGFRRGALGGVVVFAGKRLAVEPFDGAGLAGRGVAAVGSSLVRNAGAGQPGLGELVLPLGPARFYVRPGAATPVRVQVDVVAAAVLAALAVDSDLEFDAAASLSAGTPVFQERIGVAGAQWMGRSTAGVIRISGNARDWGREYRRRVLAHERVHVLQYDQGFLLVGAPLEQAVAPRVPGGTALARWVDLGLETPIWAAISHFWEYSHRPWEREADLLSRTRDGWNSGR